LRIPVICARWCKVVCVLYVLYVVCVCVCCFVYNCLWTTTQITVTVGQTDWVSRPQRLLIFQSCKFNYWLCVVEPSCWQNSYSTSTSLKFAKNGIRICPLHISEFIVSKKKLHSVILNSMAENRTHTYTCPLLSVIWNAYMTI
jgi:hypothetical protein